ncbi:MAG: lipopolysaccharide biosynthesis protein [Motiliproteus sp.]
MSAESDLKHQVIHSLKWVTIGKVFTQVIRWAITFWVIRLLTPEDYGIVAMANVFFWFLILLAGSLFTPTIIQAKTITTSTLKQLYGMIIIVQLSLFLLQQALAKPISLYYNSNEVMDILQVSAWCLIIYSFQIIPSAMLARDMEFKSVSIATAVANIVAAFLTLALAYAGYGYWSLVISELFLAALLTAITFYIKPFLHLPSFGISEIKDHLKFGSLFTVHSILFYIFLYMDVAIAGRYLDVTEVGFLAVAIQLSTMPQKKIIPLIKQVAFPAFSKLQNQPSKISYYLLKAQKLSLLISIPIFWGLASVIDLIIPLVLGEKWNNAIIPTMFILLIMPLRFSDELFSPALKSLRKVKHLIINAVILIAIMSTAIFIGVDYGSTGIALAWCIGFPVAYVITTYRNIRMLSIAPLNYIKIFTTPIISGIAMLLTVTTLKSFSENIDVLMLSVSIALGASVFLATTFIIDKDSITQLRNLKKPKKQLSDQ